MNALIWTPNVLVRAPAAQGWTFDLLSALIGAAITAALAIVLYWYRAVIGQAWQAASAAIRQQLDKLTAGLETRYYDGLLSTLPAFEVLPRLVPLETLYVAPRFVAPLPRPSLVQASSHPASHVILGSVWQAARRLLVAGRTGSGRTAILVHLARTFTAQNIQGTYDPDQRHIPIYIHLIELSREFSRSLAQPDAAGNPPSPAKAPDDTAAWLVANVASHSSALIARNIGNLVRRWLQSNQAVILIDGLDELGDLEQQQAMTWISQLVERYPEPRYVVAAPTRGYGKLTEAGFAALPLTEWDVAETSELARRWIKLIQCGPEDVARLADALKPLPGLAPLPIDLSLAALVWQKSGAAPRSPSVLYDQAVEHVLGELTGQSPLSPLLSRSALGRLATKLIKEGRTLATRAELEQIIAELVPKPESAQEPVPTESVPTPSAPSGKLPKSVSETIDALVKSELLAARGNDYAFCHRRVQCYLAAWHIVQHKDLAALAELLNAPLRFAAWADLFEFCAGMLDFTRLIEAYLSQKDDLFRTRLWTTITWAAAAPPEAAWRGRVLGEVARVWMQPNQLAVLRERALLGLISTQDKGLPFLFKKALANPDPIQRAQAIRGLGIMGREADLTILVKALQDPDPSVREAAIHAIGAIPAETALETLIDILLQADETMRQAAAEALVHQGDKGKAILRDAMQEEDVLVRRAATFGLRQIGEPWAVELLGQVEQNDSQWAVRSAATDALRLAQESATGAELDLSPIKLQDQGWLIEWAATRGMSVAASAHLAMPVLLKALSEGDARAKLATIRTLARIGNAEAIGPLRQALSESDVAIQTEAWRALAELGARTGEHIPA